MIKKRGEAVCASPRFNLLSGLLKHVRDITQQIPDGMHRLVGVFLYLFVISQYGSAYHAPVSYTHLVYKRQINRSAS